MAQAYKSVLNLVLVLSLALTLSIANGIQLGIGYGKTDSTLVCNSVYGAQSGDTCTTVAQEFNFPSVEVLVAINPNIDCDAIFVGQWLCIDGSA